MLGSEAGSTQAGLPVLGWQWAAGTAPAWQPSLRTTLFPERRDEPETLPQVPSKHTWGVTRVDPTTGVSSPRRPLVPHRPSHISGALLVTWCEADLHQVVSSPERSPRLLSTRPWTPCPHPCACTWHSLLLPGPYLI